jgi:hypothetical protein
MPRDFIDKLGNIGNLAIFVDEESRSYEEVSSSCDFRTISIDFPEGTGTVEIVGTSAPSLIWTDNSTLDMPANLDVVVDGKTYQVSAHGFAKLCSWEFVKEEKKLAIHYDDGYNLTSLTISIPKELLGSPYAIVVDGKPLDVNNTRSFNQTKYELLSGSAKYNDLSIHTESPIKNIEVIGTTVAPEFGSLVSLVIMTAVIGIIVMMGRMMRFRD